MKKITLLLLLSFFLQEAMAAISSTTYPMTESNSSGILVATGSRTRRLDKDANNPSSSVLLPFTFTFDGTAYNNIFIGQDGWIKLGGSSATTQATNDLNSTTNIPKIAPYWDDLEFSTNSGSTNGGAYTFVNGTSPSRVFVVEWVIRVPKDGNPIGKIQVALYEGSNNFQFFYSGMSPSTSTYGSYSVGFSNKTGVGSNQGSVTTSASSNASSIAYVAVNNSNTAKIPNTRSYLFTTGVASFFPSSGITLSNLSTTGMTINFTGGTGPNHLVLVKASSAIATHPTNNTSYTASTTFGSGSNIGGGYVVANNTATSVTLTGMTPNTPYYINIYEQVGTGSSATFNTLLFASDDGGTLAPAPATAPSTPVFAPTTKSTINFTCSKGAGSRRMVICQKDNETTNDAENGHQYTHSSVYGEGDGFENGYVVYDGPDNNFSVSNLEGGKTYHFTVIEYNGTGHSCSYANDKKYKTNSTTNAVAPTAPAGSGTFGEIKSDEVYLSFNKGDGARRIVVCKKGSEMNENAEDGRKYRADSTFGNGDDCGSGKVVYDGTGNSCRIKHLDDNSTYHFTVIEYNGDNDKTSYDNDHKYKCSASTPRTDSDNDGVADIEDEFPNDAHKAYTFTYPSAGFGTLMYEDLWPAMGDYDFNDLVVDYRYTTTTNASNNVVEVSYTFVTRAIGGSLHNGFAFQLDGINKDKITSITGSKASGAAWISLNGNGTEAGHTNANVLVLDDAYELFTVPGGYSFVNTDPAAPYLGTDTTRMTVKFLVDGVAPSGGTLNYSAFPTTVFNPYLIVGQDRGKEVHLLNKVPTAKVNNTYFGKDADRSTGGRYYLTENNLPWALNINTSVPFAKERVDFSQAYLKFIDWAQSGGSSNATWYLNTSGNRDASKLIAR
ncbi:MAG: hypothetical protein CFE21_08155 [Bacteroidetes bacterium B1(2017)]|nr:MAG: hypothetical protein CFE21_08155 [Bacteroidetes bacterium B1(2017)]